MNVRLGLVVFSVTLKGFWLISVIVLCAFFLLFIFFLYFCVVLGGTLIVGCLLYKANKAIVVVFLEILFDERIFGPLYIFKYAHVGDMPRFRLIPNFCVDAWVIWAVLVVLFCTTVF